MKCHFQLTLRISADDLMILTAYLEHAYDRTSTGAKAIPRPLARRLRELSAAHPANTALQHLVTAACPDFEIRAITDDAVTIATIGGGASLPRTLALLGSIVPSCLANDIVYAPLERARASASPALH